MPLTKKYTKHKEYMFSEGQYFECYYRTYGSNYEVGIMWNDKTIFFGNFINKTEATAWYTAMNKEMTHFLNYYEFMPNMKVTWYTQFAHNYFYGFYYKYLYSAFTKYNKNYKKAYTADLKTYKKYEYKYSQMM